MADLVFASRPLARRLPKWPAVRNLPARRRGLASAHHKYGGKGYIAGQAEGIVTVAGEPAARRIYLFARPAMTCIADTWSKEDGTYRFTRLSTDAQYLMIAADHKKQYEPVGYDYITPALPDD